MRAWASTLLLWAALGAGAAWAADTVPAKDKPSGMAAAGVFTPTDDTVTIEISEYAGYAGLLYANGGLEPNPDSVFAREFGFKVKLTVSESEDWSPLNAGTIAAAPTTVDVLAVYGGQLKVRVPVLLGFSRGTDGLIVDRAIKRVNDLKGRRVALCQFTEADFFMRYLAAEASLPIKSLDGLDDAADPEAVNLVYTEDAFGAGDLYARELAAKSGALAGCVTWDPKTTEVVEASEGAAKLLVTNRNLLIVADILMVNAGFAENNPRWMAGLVKGILRGNAAVRENPAVAATVLAAAFGWSAEDSADELEKVHLANWPENHAFFSGQMDSAGSFAYIYETARDIYGPEIARRAPSQNAFLLPAALEQANADGAFNQQTAAIQPITADGDADVEAQELLSRNLYFYFDPNSARLSAARGKENDDQLRTIRQWLRVSPGSRVLLRGHADGSRLPEIEEREGANHAREARLKLKSLSQERCVTLRERLAEDGKLDADRVETRAVGADEPTGQGPAADRRVEVQWFTFE